MYSPIFLRATLMLVYSHTSQWANVQCGLCLGVAMCVVSAFLSRSRGLRSRTKQDTVKLSTSSGPTHRSKLGDQ